MSQLQIDIGRLKDGRYYLDIDDERVLVSHLFDEILERLTKDAKIYFRIPIEEKRKWFQKKKKVQPVNPYQLPPPQLKTFDGISKEYGKKIRY